MNTETQTKFFVLEGLPVTRTKGALLGYKGDTGIWVEEDIRAGFDVKTEGEKWSKPPGISENLKIILRSNYIDQVLTLFYQPKGSDSLTVGDFKKWLEKKQLLNANEFIKWNLTPTIDLLTTEMMLHSQDFILHDRLRVLNFLKDNSDLLGILREGREIILSIFNQSTKIALSVLDDHDIIGFEQLIVKIQVREDVETALSKLDQFDNAWFLDQLPRIANRLIFNLEFI